ncbi:MAG: transglutaminase-like domain-containing protein [Eubacteriales bacterium]
MDLLMKHNSFDKYLQASEAIDLKNPKIQFAAQFLMDKMMRELEEDPGNALPDPEMQLARTIYEYVRDRISHSWDMQNTLITWKASDVLENKHGLCYAKSHLLAALLRANGIPAGLCYQYLRLDGTQQSELILHGLNAVYFASIGRWVRLDARGNKPGIAAEFSVTEEKIAFPVHPGLGETDIPIIFTGPDRTVLRTLQKYENLPELMENLPQKLFGDE